MSKFFSTQTRDLYAGRGIFAKIFNIEMRKRYSFVLEKIKGKTVLEVGAYDGKLSVMLNKMGLEAISIDIEPQDPSVKHGNVLDLKYPDKSFDVVVALDVLEHVEDPVKALNEIKRVAKKQIFVCVPNEPYFTLFRFVALRGWCDEHLIALTPKFLKIHLGKPKSEMFFMLKREYIAEWRKDKQKSDTTPFKRKIDFSVKISTGSQILDNQHAS